MSGIAGLAAPEFVFSHKIEKRGCIPRVARPSFAADTTGIMRG
jgi:hypothetical protein